MAKAEWAIVDVRDRDNLVVLEPYKDRKECDAELAKRRAALPKEERYKIAILPLDKKGNPLMPP